MKTTRDITFTLAFPMKGTTEELSFKVKAKDEAEARTLLMAKLEQCMDQIEAADIADKNKPPKAAAAATIPAPIVPPPVAPASTDH